jgi:hypothetical protein
MPEEGARQSPIRPRRGRHRQGLLAIPAKNVEPYRIWFEFLQLAFRDPDLQVDENYYADWGDIADLSFDDWWDDHWEYLFAVEIGVYRINKLSKLNQNRDNEIIVRLPLYRNIRETLKRVKEILEEHQGGDRLTDMRQGKYRFNIGDSIESADITATLPSVHFLRLLPKLEEMLGYYRFWVQTAGQDPEQRKSNTFINYFNWIEEEKLRRQRTGNTERLYMPTGLSEYVQFLKYQENKDTGQLGFEYDSLVNASARRQAARNFEKAKQIARNVSIGIFPGDYGDGEPLSPSDSDNPNYDDNAQ